MPTKAPPTASKSSVTSAKTSSYLRPAYTTSCASGVSFRAFLRLRLRGLDTAALYTQAGRDAKAFVEHALADCPAVVVSTWRTDSYGRYLADVKYQAGEGDPGAILEGGTYLNRELLRQGLAVRYLE